VGKLTRARLKLALFLLFNVAANHKVEIPWDGGRQGAQLFEDWQNQEHLQISHQVATHTQNMSLSRKFFLTENKNTHTKVQ
jgi:hypothetical protein